MANPLIQPSDLLQTSPDVFVTGKVHTFEMNVFQDDGTNNVDVNETPTFNSGTCSIRNLAAPTVEIDAPDVTITPITNGATISFQIDTSVTATYPIGKYVAVLEYLWEDKTPDDKEVDLYYFNVVGVTDPFK